MDVNYQVCRSTFTPSHFSTRQEHETSFTQLEPRAKQGKQRPISMGDRQQIEFTHDFPKGHMDRDWCSDHMHSSKEGASDFNAISVLHSDDRQLP